MRLDLKTPLLWQLGLELFKDDLVEARAAFRERAIDEPMETTVQAVLAGATLFYLAEHEANPKVDGFPAALEYIATSLNVGSTSIYPVTQAGKTIAALMMTAGPSLAAGFLGPNRSDRERDEDERRARDEALLAKLDAILAELQKR